MTGVTAFTASSSDSPEDSRVSELEDIDLHHGWYSSNPPYTIIEVIGATLSERIKAELALYGFNDFSSRSDGFVAVRPLPPDPRI